MKFKYCIVTAIAILQISAVMSAILLEASIPKPSLVIIFDDTGSMKRDLGSLRSAVVNILNKLNSYGKKNTYGNYVLSVFNDPDVRVNQTADSNELVQWLNEIHPRGGGDCPEMALTGIKKALELSEAKSHAFVFTDAGAKDHEMEKEVIDLAKGKEITLNFLLTGKCKKETETGDVFDRLASKTGGQVKDLKKNEVGDVLTAMLTKN